MQSALTALVAFIGDGKLTSTIANLEYELDGRSRQDLDAILKARGISSELLRSAVLIRRRLGRINDVVHAVAITLALAELLAPGETLSRPSLAAGNDRSRLYDVETDQRVAEFKLGRWDGSDAMRKRHVFKDLVSLAADESGRQPELYVLGDRPSRFLRETRSTAKWALDRFPASRALFERRFGELDTPIPQFVSGPAQRVKIVDLEQRLPHIFPPDSDG